MYRTVETTFWTDPDIRALPFEHRTVMLYLITGPHSHLSGIYYLPLTAASEELGLSLEAVQLGLSYLAVTPKRADGAPFIAFDPDYHQVWVRNMFGYQGKGLNGIKGVAAYLQTLHRSPLVGLFLERYPDVRPFLPKGFEIVEEKNPLRTPFEPPSKGVIGFPSPSPALLVLGGKKKLKREKRLQEVRIETLYPEDWTPKESHEKLARALGLDLKVNAAHFAGKAKEEDWRAKNWDQKFTNFLLQEKKFQQRRRTP